MADDNQTTPSGRLAAELARDGFRIVEINERDVLVDTGVSKRRYFVPDGECPPETIETMTPAERRLWHKFDGIAHNAEAVKFCEDLQRRGLAKQYDAMFGNVYFSLTPAGERAFYGE